MEISELKSMWQAHEKKIEKSLQLNIKCLELIQAQKVKSKLNPLRWARGIETLGHAIIICWLVSFLFNHLEHWVYAGAACALIAFYVTALINCLKQIILISRIDYSNDLVNLQSSLEKLRLHMINNLRLAFLVIPTFLAYPIIGMKALGFDLLTHVEGDWWQWQIAFSIFMIPVCIWLYKEVSYKNIHKNWVKAIIGTAGGRVVESMQFLHDLERLKQDK